MPTLAQLMSCVAERKGYTVQGSDEGALLARKGEEKLLVAWSLDASVTTADASLFLAAMEQVSADKGILVAPKGVDQAAKDLLAAKKTVESWAESRLVVEVGEAMVKAALENPTQALAPANAPGAGPAAPAATVAAVAPRASVQQFGSLVARAVASSGRPHDPGTVMFMPSKPTRQLATGAQAAIPQRGQALGYAWGGMGGGSSPGVAQVRNGRRPIQQTEAPTAPPPLASAALSDDVEIITTPRRRAPEPTPAPVAEAPRMIVPEESDVELITTPRRKPAAASAAAAPAVVEAPKPAAAPTSLSASLSAPAVEEEEYEIISSPKKAAKTAEPAPAASNANGSSTALRVRLSREEAFSKAQVKGGASINLALVPHIAFEFDLAMERPGMPAPITGKGVILVSSMTGDLRVVDTLEFSDGEPAGARKDAVKLQAVDVYDKVKAYLSKTYTKMVNTERELAGNTVMETVKLSPDIHEMGLNHRGIVHLPVWETVTPEGPVRIDAYSGERL